jgi:hypothetical protein
LQFGRRQGRRSRTEIEDGAGPPLARQEIQHGGSRGSNRWPVPKASAASIRLRCRWP